MFKFFFVVTSLRAIIAHRFFAVSIFGCFACGNEGRRIDRMDWRTPFTFAGQCVVLRVVQVYNNNVAIILIKSSNKFCLATVMREKRGGQ